MPLTSVLVNAILKENTFCCLCTKIFTDNEESVCLEDEIFLDSVGSVKFVNILSHVLSFEFSETSFLNVVCHTCTDSILKSYKFLKLCKDNLQNLISTLINLSDCILNTTIDGDWCKTIFVSIDAKNFTSKKYYDNILPDSCSTALRRFETVLKNESTNSSIEDEQVPYKDPFYTEVTREPKLKRKIRNKVKTCDMLFDKNDKTNLKCKECLKIFPKACNLRQHYIRVHAPKNFKCTKCSRSFGSANFLQQHEHESHCTVMCNECGKTFYNRHTLKMHELSHKLRLVCTDCGRVYKRRITFNKHLKLKICEQRGRKTNAEAKYMCDHCSKKYSNKSSLRVHIKFEHGDGKAHVCTWCNKKFHAQSILKAHTLKHTQEKNFTCEICGGKFVTKESLLYHTRTHTGEKPYKCDFCDGRFLSASRRADHMKRHHNTAIFECDICQTKFRAKSCLQKHRKRHFNPMSRLHHPHS